VWARPLVTCGVPVIIQHPRTSAGECTLPPHTANSKPSAIHPQALTQRSAAVAPSRKVYDTIVRVTGVLTTPTQRQSERAHPNRSYPLVPV
jgi:hypothetical protein